MSGNPMFHRISHLRVTMLIFCLIGSVPALSRLYRCPTCTDTCLLRSPASRDLTQNSDFIAHLHFRLLLNEPTFFFFFSSRHGWPLLLQS